MINYILFSIFIFLQVLDFWTTYLCITSGKGHEANPLIAPLIDKYGVVAPLVGYKLFAIIIGFFVMQSVVVIVILNLVYSYVVFQNYQIWRK